VADTLPRSVSALPLGLLTLLGIQTQGRYPGAVAESYQPEIDLWSLLTTQRVSYTLGNLVNASTLGFVTSSPGLIVGPQQLWYVRGFGARMTTGSSEAVTWRLSYAAPENIAQVTGGIGFTDFGYVTQGASVSQNLAVDFSACPMHGRLFAPGWRLGVDVQSVTGTYDLSLHIEYFQIAF
jgi:hypothetical protein